MAGFRNLLRLLEYLIQAGSILLIIATKQWAAAMAVGLLILPFFYISIKNGREEYEAYEESGKHFRRAKYFRQLLTGRNNMEERSLFGYTDYVNQKWSEQYEKAILTETNVNKKVFLRVNIADGFTILLTCCIAFVLVFPVFSGKMTAGLYIALIKGIMNFTDTISWQFAQVTVNFEKSKMYLQDVTEFIRLEEERGIDGERAAAIPKGALRTVEFKNVSFTYPGTDQAVLDGISFILRGDKQYAFVGENGAGKTTIVKLLTGLYDTYTGEILINGINIRQMERNRLMACFSIVYQDFSRYEISVRDNIWPLSESMDKADYEQRIREVVKGKDTLLSRDFGGIDLSGGQWQRLAIARGFYKESNCLFLDEPTAAIDPFEEASLYHTFERFARGKTTFLVTHRLGAVKMAGTILVMKEGKIVGNGTHEELLKNCEEYAGMWAAQSSQYETPG